MEFFSAKLMFGTVYFRRKPRLIHHLINVQTYTAIKVFRA